MDMKFSYGDNNQLEVEFQANISFDLYVQVIGQISGREVDDVRRILLGMSTLMSPQNGKHKLTVMDFQDETAAQAIYAGENQADVKRVADAAIDGYST